MESLYAQCRLVGRLIMLRRGSTILWGVAVVVVALLFASLCRIFVVEMFTVAPQQMENTLLPGDRILVEKWHYGVRLPQSYISLPFVDTLPYVDVPARLPAKPLPYKRMRMKPVEHGDVIAFNYPTGEARPLAEYPTAIARCIGVPGDTIEVLVESMYINGVASEQSEQVTEPYLVPDSLLSSVEEAMTALWGGVLPHQAVGEQSLFVIDRQGYNQLATYLPPSHLPQLVTLSHDSYYIELPPYGSEAVVTPHNAAFYADIINRYEPCRVELRGHELYRDGERIEQYRFSQPYYWVVCDNRTASTDSRTFGVLPHSHVIGRCGMIIFSIDSEQKGFDSWRINRFFQYRKL
ncbi:MAG: signal peptidase I [Bacteroidales bacterium]|nr:signal peptidase I [Bacteroidales bacterium]